MGLAVAGLKINELPKDRSSFSRQSAADHPSPINSFCRKTIWSLS